MPLGHTLAPPDIPEEINPADSYREVELEPVVQASARGSRLPSAPRPLRRTIGPSLLLVLGQALSATGVLHPDVLASPGTIARAGAAAGSRLRYAYRPGSTATSRARYWCPNGGLLPPRCLG